MGEIQLIDDIMAPRDALNVKFQGRNPFTAVAMVNGLIKDVMKVPGKDIFENEVRWDATSENREFYGKWAGRRQEDRWTETRIRIIIQGQQHAKEKTGWCNIELKGVITTTYQYSNFLQRAFWWFYNYMFYYKQRRNYFEFAKDEIYNMKERFQRALGIEERG